MTTTLLFMCPAPLTIATRAINSPLSTPSLATPCTLPQTCYASLYSPSTLEPSYPIPAPSSLAAALSDTTIYHTIPSVPEHHSQSSPLAHRNDGDAYVLAVSFPPAQADNKQYWVRGRFVRTEPFFIESRAMKRIYRGAYGTAGDVGIKAPTKPKASSAKGISTWRNSKGSLVVLAYGIRSLPFTIDCNTLATKGVTALGSVLTASDELIGERPTELAVPPLRVANSTITVGLGRSPTAKIVAAFVTEVSDSCEVVKRHPKITVPNSCDVIAMAACEQYCVLAIHRVVEESGGLLSAVFGTGKQKQAPQVDLQYGTEFTVLCRASGRHTTCRLPGILLTRLVSVRCKGSLLLIDAIELVPKDGGIPVRLDTIADAQSGRLWRAADDSAVSTSLPVQLKLNISREGDVISVSAETPIRFQPPKNVVILDCTLTSCTNIAKSHTESKTERVVYTVFDIANQKSGIATCESSDGSERKWTTWFTDSNTSTLTAGAISPDGDFVSVLMTNDNAASGGVEDASASAELSVFQIDDIHEGAVANVLLDGEQFGHISGGIGAVWGKHSADWGVCGGKPAKSSYEIFKSHEWNDVQSGFSGLNF